MAVNRHYSSNAIKTTLSAAITNTDTSITVAATTGFPASTPYTLILDPNTTKEELVTVTGVAGTTLTVTRGVDSTSAVSHASGAAVHHGVSARDFREPQEHIDASTNVHGLAGGASVVGTTSTQTLSNKTLTSPTINGATVTGTVGGGTYTSATLTAPTIGDLTNANHTHAGGSSGGLLPTAAPTASAVGDAAVTGTATTYSRTDHKHERETFGTVSAETSFGLSSSNGSASSLARSDHKHGTPALPEPSKTADATLISPSNTSPTNGSPVVGFSFTAPASGKVLIQCGGDIECPSIANGSIILIATVRSGGTVGSGTIVYDGDTSSSARVIATDTSGVTGDQIRVKAGSWLDVVSGLTPGNTYNAHTRHYVTGGTGTVRARMITVIPIPA